MTDTTAAPGTGEPSPTRVGFSGLGRMGRLMALNLQRAGFDLTVHNRTPAKAQAFAASTGAKVAGSGRELAEAASIIVTMVADGPAVASLLEGPDGIAAGLSAGDVVVDMGTTGRHPRAGRHPHLPHDRHPHLPHHCHPGAGRHPHLPHDRHPHLPHHCHPGEGRDPCVRRHRVGSTGAAPERVTDGR